MEDLTSSPVVIALLFVLRCVVPLAILLGISYLLRRFGLVWEPPPTEDVPDDGENTEGGGLAHGNV